MHLLLKPSGSLKDKRRILKSIMEKLRNRYNVACAEVADQDNWKVATIGIACVSSDPFHARSVLEDVLKWVEVNLDGEVSRYEIDVV